LIGRLALSFLIGGTSILCAQAVPTASRTADAQIGVAYSIGRPDYPPHTTAQGFAAYADFDFTSHLGVEAEFHQVYSTTGNQSFQRTYEIGGRYFRTYGPMVPYVKAMYGRGDFNYPFGHTELGYNMFAGGLGADYKLGQYLRIRGEYEFQKWTSFPNGGLTPQIITIGVAYHFAGGPRYN
jgi:opacity protein-like surface antigen